MENSRSAGVFQDLEDDAPSVVGDYRLVARLGSGGMGKVYLSYTPAGRPVAIKVIRPEFAEDPEFRRRFADEVAAARRVQGLCTAPVLDSDTDGPRPWLATAYVPGPTLSSAVAAHGPLPVPTVLLLVAGIAEALQAIHGAGLVHRDLKPSNVLLAPDGPRVIDFGIARAADATALTATGVAVGTPSFMAPEQASGTEVTAATDVFALGQVAVFAATAAPAYGDGPSHAVLYRIVHQEPNLSAVPAELQDLVARCLAKDPGQRPALSTVIELCRAAGDDTQLRRGEGWLPAGVAAGIAQRPPAPGPAPTAPLTVVVPPSPPAPPPSYIPKPSSHAPKPPRKRTTRTVLFTALGALAVTASAVAGYTLTNSDSTAPDDMTRVKSRVDYQKMTLPAGSHFELADTSLTPRQGYADDIFLHCAESGGCYLGADRSQLIRLGRGEKGSRETCRKKAGFTSSIDTDKLSKGSQICVRNQQGWAGLLTIKSMSLIDIRDASVDFHVEAWIDD
ncbi:serine/threonine-protein kinase [Streptomyces griseocarneus]|uniref:serine/threonine-protein kinase n=1 Tax=Streptomyces griseocarneus TaxID=51201 RepID=UPI00167EC8C8|nr:serine/threonine-protein kinase [Streptomyces griseocarneus]MBZ6474991.1 serine/threonine protein kinase [Streptomyces griseocarneus]